MKSATDAPADTTMMRIVHGALRRDLDRAGATLTAPLGRTRRRAVAAHLVWMMDFVDAHHASEDDGLYPLVRSRLGEGSADRALLDRMTGDHESIAPAIVEVRAAASALLADSSDPAVTEVLAALDGLNAVLLPHLRDEEELAMPIVSRTITAAEWQAQEKEHNLDPKSFAQLGFEGHWLIDDVSDADRDAVLGLVPPMARFMLLNGFRRRYRRHTAACWSDGGDPPRRVQMDNRVSVTVDASVEDVWSVVSDPTRVGEWSGECVAAEWRDGSTEAVVGARFRGRNRAGIWRWGRECEVLAAEPHELRWRTVPTRLYPDSSEWRITVAPDDAGAEITESFEVVRAPKVLSVVYAFMVPSHRDRTAGLAADLERLGAAARRGSLSRTGSDPARDRDVRVPVVGPSSPERL